MSSHSADTGKANDERLDYLVRWALHGAVADAEPSPHLWERIQTRIIDGAGAATADAPARRKSSSRRGWLSQLAGAGAPYPVPGDPRLAWQRRLHAFDMRASLSILRITEGKMPFLRLVS
jgi:hypothetical protein